MDIVLYLKRRDKNITSWKKARLTLKYCLLEHGLLMLKQIGIVLHPLILSFLV